MRARLLLSGLLTLAIVVLGADRAGAGGGCHEGSAAAVDATVVNLEAMCMRPGVARVPVGTTVTFVNRDDMTHNLYGPGWFNGDVAPHDSTSRRFDVAGTYPYACTLHAGMAGAVVVGEAQLVASREPAPPGAPDAGGTSLAVVLGIGAVVLAGIAGSFALGARWR